MQKDDLYIYQSYRENIMKIGLITTLNTNIGDDFIREGIIYSCRQIFSEDDLEFVMINKHIPYTLYPKWHPLYWTKFIPKKRHLFSRVLSRLISWFGFSVFESCDAIIQCGAPVYWYDCHKAEWSEVFWRGIASRLSKKIPVLNIAAGSCYPWERIPEAIDDRNDARYMQEIFDICQKTLVRDECSKRLLNGLGRSPVLLPCSAFLAARPYQDLAQTNEFVFVNYMPGGSHYDFDQHIDSNAWKTTVKTFIAEASKNHRLAMICHNKKEYDAALEIAPDTECFFPKTVEEYFKIAVRGQVGIFNRMHASVGFAGLGIPSMVIGADTRMLMVDKIGLPNEYVKNVTADIMLHTLDELIANREQERIRLLELQANTEKAYLAELSFLASEKK